MICRRDGLEIIELGEKDGTVIFDSVTGNTNVLDPVAADIFKCFSKHTEIDSVIEELAATYNELPETIREDIIEFTDSLLETGLLVKK